MLEGQCQYWHLDMMSCIVCCEGVVGLFSAHFRERVVCNTWLYAYELSHSIIGEIGLK